MHCLNRPAFPGVYQDFWPDIAAHLLEGKIHTTARGEPVKVRLENATQLWQQAAVRVPAIPRNFSCWFRLPSTSAGQKTCHIGFDLPGGEANQPNSAQKVARGRKVFIAVSHCCLFLIDSLVQDGNLSAIITASDYLPSFSAPLRWAVC